MPRRVRKLVGTIAMVTFVCVYALVAMALAVGRVQELPALAQTLVYILLGLIWIVPLMPLIRWMEKPDHEQT